MIVFKTLPDSLPSAPKMGTVVSLGLFDGLHRGHFAVLNDMKLKSDGLATAVFTFSTDMSKPEAKTNSHLMSCEMRDRLLQDFGVDYIVEPEFDSIRNMSPEEFVKGFLIDRLHVKIVFCGEDFRFGKKAAADVSDLRRLLSAGSNSAGLVAVPVLREDGEVISTTRIRNLLQNGDIERANALLGRPFAIDFAVEHGRKLGRTLGLPTINQAFPENFAVPKYGVYASFTVLNGKEHISVTNVGVKPTIGSSHVLAETYIHDFTGNLYGERVPVKLMRFIRCEKKFSSVEELKTHIEKDNKLATQMLGVSVKNPAKN